MAGYKSASFDPDAVATSSDAASSALVAVANASDAASKAIAYASGASDAASAAMAKAAAASSKIAAQSAVWEAVSADGDKGDITVGGSGTTLTIDSGVVSQSKLKTSTSEVYTTTNANVTLGGGEYGFYPQHYRVSGAAHHCYIASSATNSTYLNSIWMSGGVGTEAYAKQRYVASSGEVFWIFALILKSDSIVISSDIYGNPIEVQRLKGSVLCMWSAPDHPCFGNGGNPLLVPHPFLDYNPAIHDIIVCNPSASTISEINGLRSSKENDKPDKTFLQIVVENYEIDCNSNPQWPTTSVTVGLPEGHDWVMMQKNDLIIPTKKVIPQTHGMICRSLRMKTTS